ncbi:energy transducer TonB [Lysobacter sp. BMK333-48F3]|uniref:energy transducer TonB n=1 Tax=Lysobacter sp. BMK333-48F3 TaxID=2867962 RepID=UPI001C8C0661|nr:energy transducer TonB [Lysobacter sp. BMK333-48F3]MBX9401022.1 energy transducer TonB [Lysobacter sp. BMK333-48F3]
MTQDLELQVRNDDDREGLNWARIAGITCAIAVHAAALLLLLAPMTPPAQQQEEEQVTMVNIIKPPPPRPTPTPPPPDQPPIENLDPSPIDPPAPPPAPPAPPQVASDIGSSVDPSSRRLNPPKYPPTEARQGVGGTVVLVISIDAQGNVLDVQVEKSSRNRNLDRAAMDAARKWRFNPEVRNGQPVASRVRVPVDFVPPN